MCFLPQDAESRDAAIARLERFIEIEGQILLGWRDVPTNESWPRQGSARIPAGHPPSIVARGPRAADQDAFERKLLTIRKQTQNPLVGAGREARPARSRRLLHPVLLEPHDRLQGPVARDAGRQLLQRPARPAAASRRWRSSTSVSRPTPSRAGSSRTRTASSPHNGEINTVRGNVNWMNARRRTLESPLLGADLDKMWPLIPHGQSDTACLDNALELLLAGGYSLAHAMMLLIPEAWAGNAQMEPKRRAFYEYHAALMEPWDGPAAIAFTDGRQIGATLDRNGLRPARFCVTDDDRVIMASESGVLPIPEEKHRPQVAAAARKDAADRPRRGPHRRGRRDQVPARVRAALWRMAAGNAVQAGGASGEQRDGASGAFRRRAARPPSVRSATPRKT